MGTRRRYTKRVPVSQRSEELSSLAGLGIVPRVRLVKTRSGGAGKARKVTHVVFIVMASEANVVLIERKYREVVRTALEVGEERPADGAVVSSRAALLAMGASEALAAELEETEEQCKKSLGRKLVSVSIA